MGFFSSRKVEEEHHIPTDKTVVQVIRSKFYGKQKGKEREHQSFQSHPTPVSDILYPPISTDNYATNRSSTPTQYTHSQSPIDSNPPTSKIHDPKLSNDAVPHAPRTTDVITMTLAQRLNELAAANSQGLLDHEEYRLLRQDLFERFAGSTSVPTEVPVVPVIGQRRVGKAGSSSLEPQRPLSNFHVDTPRSPSIRSQSSVTSSVTRLFNRASGRRPISRDFGDASSIFSSTSTTSNFFRGSMFSSTVSKKGSSSSLATDGMDAMSISSRRTGTPSDRHGFENSSHLRMNSSRSGPPSIRKLPTPPSSFPTRVPIPDSMYGIPASDINDVFDAENLKTAQDIRREIAAVETEARRLMDAFNGLELTTLTRRRREHRLPSLTGMSSGKEWHDGVESAWILTPEKRSLRRLPDVDSISMRSGTSAGTTPSMTKSAYSGRIGQGKVMPSSPSQSGSLHRMGSASSGSSQFKSGKHLAPPIPSLPPGFENLSNNSSSINLARSTGHLPLSTLGEESFDEEASNNGIKAIDNDMADIRRRRGEVIARYDARLEYLRAKLKGAELHEKLLRK